MERGYLYAIGAAIAWGLMYAMDGKILAKMAPGNLLFVQSLFMTILMLPFFLWNKGIEDLQSAGTSKQLLIGATVLLATVANVWILTSIKLLGPTVASSFEISYPFFVAIFSMLLFGGRLSWPVGLGGVIIFIGSLIIIRYGES